MSRPIDEAALARSRGKFVDPSERLAASAVTGPPWWARGPPGEMRLEAIISLPEVAAFTGLSVDTIKRHYAHMVRRLSPRRVGMKVRDALAIGALKT
jgi:hypothetical protein